MYTSILNLNHFVIARKDNLAPPTDASTTVCLYEFSAAKQVSIALLEKETFSCFQTMYTLRMSSMNLWKGSACDFRNPFSKDIRQCGGQCHFSEFPPYSIVGEITSIEIRLCSCVHLSQGPKMVRMIYCQLSRKSTNHQTIISPTAVCVYCGCYLHVVGNQMV